MVNDLNDINIDESKIKKDYNNFDDISENDKIFIFRRIIFFTIIDIIIFKYISSLI